MEEEAPSRRSVAELAGRFKGPPAAHDAAGNEAQKVVRRRPPRSLQLPKTHGDQQEPPGVTSPQPAKAKRNSALIEKLQANLALSPTALMPSPKSPGIRLLPLVFPPPSAGSAPVTTVTPSSTTTPTSPFPASPLTEEEGPTSFEAPPTVVEGSILLNFNKGRARHSIRRRPPSRCHRKSSSGDEVSVTNEEGGGNSLSSPSEPEDKTTGGGGGGEDKDEGEVFKQEAKTDEVKEDETAASTCPEKHESQEDNQSKINVDPRGEEEEEGDGSSSGGKEEAAEEKTSGEQQEEESTGSKEQAKMEQTTCQSSAR